jgi:hypothetical protein
MHFGFVLVCVSDEGMCWVKGVSPKSRGTSPDRRTCRRWEKRRDLWRDVMKRRLREDLMDTSQNYPSTFRIE